MERVLLTGGTGFLGHATVRRLLDAGFAVRVLTRGSWPFQAHPKLERADGDMTDAGSLQRAARGCDAVVHMAARKNDEHDSDAVNVAGTRALCAAAEAAGVARFVYVSTQSARLAKPGTYGRTKREGEDAVRGSTLPWVILRPSLVYGDASEGVAGTIERMSALPAIPVFGPGTALYRPIHVEDVAAVIVAAIAADRATRSVHSKWAI